MKKPQEPHSLALLGMQLVPDFLPRTPPFVEGVKAGSPAAKGGVRVGDLVLFVNDRVVQSCKQLAHELSFVDRLDPLKLVIQRERELLEITLEID